MKFKYLEVAKSNPSNRGLYLSSDKVINLPFSDKFTEYWRSMFLYKEEQPTENSALLGNFYIECDATDFNKNKNTMIEVCDYINREYKIPYSYFDLFITNRSLWVCIPFKVFGCMGIKNLDKIYKSMAVEINSHLLSEKLHPIDLSIYKWNGLIHALGSYLPQSKQWVTKFSYGDLTECNTKEDLRNAKWDYGFTFEDINKVKKAEEWFINTSKSFNKKTILSDKTVFLDDKNGSFCCMHKLKEEGLTEGYRNNSIFAYALYLKGKGVTKENAISIIQKDFKNPYIYTRECINTINSAFKSKKRFSCKYIKSTMSFLCENNKCNKKTSTIIVPRKFIELLNKEKVHYQCYHLLVEILFNKQIYDKSTTYSVKGMKHKKEFIDKLTILSKLKIIDIKNTKEKDELVCTLINQPHQVYKSYIIIPINFIKSKIFKNLKSEIKVFLEILRGSFIVAINKIIFNSKLETLAKNLNTTKKTIVKHLYILSKLKLIFSKYVIFNINIFKEIISSLVNKIKSNKLYRIAKNIYTKFNKMPIIMSKKLIEIIDYYIKCNKIPIDKSIINDELCLI